MSSQISGRISTVLMTKQRVITRAVFWRIEHKNPKEDICLKIGRYDKPDVTSIDESVVCLNPKSELTLTNDEFHSLLKFIQENYEPFKAGVKRFISVEDSHAVTLGQIKAILDQPDKRKAIDYISRGNIISSEVLAGLHNIEKTKAIQEFEVMLESSCQELAWQKWFEKNSWVLGTNFVDTVTERSIDTKHIADFLMKAYDGFLDVIEIKKPSKDLKFWASGVDHGNHFPSSDLIKAITQATNYIYELERESNSSKFLERVGVKIIKPRCVLIFGRSNDWTEKQIEAYRILNASYHNINILTYDHVLSRAKQIIGSCTHWR